MSNITESIINNGTVVTDTPVVGAPVVSLNVTRTLAIIILAGIVIAVLIRLLLFTAQKIRRRRNEPSREIEIPLNEQPMYNRQNMSDILVYDRHWATI
ncbi:hypothetical protein NEIRO03_1962 [Nematocida sp. AWRm78]|nr:hypothetical protein NEIRO02_1990 [Nematocida sp. AWRm79]KAI5185187.1 hypothetical protein NEIRO03_1962 [Nematocida sp. AWRm78]